MVALVRFTILRSIRREGTWNLSQRQVSHCNIAGGLELSRYSNIRIGVRPTSPGHQARHANGITAAVALASATIFNIEFAWGRGERASGQWPSLTCR